MGEGSKGWGFSAMGGCQVGRIGGEDERWVTEMRLHEGGICVGKTDGGTGSCGRALTVKSRRWGMMGKGNHKGCPYGGVDGVMVGEPVR